MAISKACKLLGLFCLIGVMGFSTHAQADDQSSGCGIGWQVLKKNSLISSTTRAWINATFSNTIAMTSGTSGCAKHSIVQNEKKAIHYTESNLGQLMIEVANGDGEHLRGLASVMGCSEESFADFSKATQGHYADIFPDSNVSAKDVLRQVRQVINAGPSLASQCQSIIRS